MKIYSDVLNVDDLHRTIAEVPGMYLNNVVKIERPKKRGHGWDLTTASNTGRRPKNTGTDGSARLMAASYDDHGHWFVLLFAIDPAAIVTKYDGVQDFHKKTCNRYQKTLA